jgi:CRP-like cAMP-binding protein
MADTGIHDMRYFFRQDQALSMLDQYLDHADKVQIKKGGVILPSCSPVDALYYLQKGVAYHSIVTPTGKERIMRVLYGPSLCAETLFFLNHESDSSEQILARANCTLYRFPRPFVEEVLMHDQPFCRILIDWLCTLSAGAAGQVADDLVKDPRYRVCKFIYNYVREYGRELPDGHVVYKGKLSHYDISKYIGVNRVSVSTVMRNLELEGVVHKTNDSLEIVDMDYFEDMVRLPFECI